MIEIDRSNNYNDSSLISIGSDMSLIRLEWKTLQENRSIL